VLLEINVTAEAFLDDLREQVASGQVIVLIGAGVSIGAINRQAAASRVGLLDDGIGRREHVVEGLPDGWGRRLHEQPATGDN